MTNLSPLYHLLETPDALPAWLRDRRRAPTTQRALEAGAMLTATLGPHAVTTAAVARHIGISQPTFYAHFESLEDYHARLLDALTSSIDPWLMGLHASLLKLAPDSFQASVSHYTRVLDLVDAHRPFLRLFLTHRRSPTDLGARLRAFEDRTQAELESHTLETLTKQALDPDLFAPQARLFTTALTTILFGLLERYLGADTSRPMCAKLLSSQHLALWAHLFRGQTLG